MSDEKLDSLERSVNYAPCFSKDQKETILEIIRVYRGWQFVIKVSKGGTVLLGIIAAAIVAWGSIGDALRSWLS